MVLFPTTERLLRLIDDLYRATMARDAASLRALLQEPFSSRLPSEVRAEALSIVTAPPDSLRAPMRLIQLRQRVIQMALDEMDSSPEPEQLELDLMPRLRAVRDAAREDARVRLPTRVASSGGSEA